MICFPVYSRFGAWGRCSPRPRASQEGEPNRQDHAWAHLLCKEWGTARQSSLSRPELGAGRHGGHVGPQGMADVIKRGARRKTHLERFVARHVQDDVLCYPQEWALGGQGGPGKTPRSAQHRGDCGDVLPAFKFRYACPGSGTWLKEAGLGIGPRRGHVHDQGRPAPNVEEVEWDRERQEATPLCCHDSSSCPHAPLSAKVAQERRPVLS